MIDTAIILSMVPRFGAAKVLKRISDAREETSRLLSKEEAYSEEFRNHALVAEYAQHIKELDRVAAEVAA